ncbi:hypothetical protein M5K25_015348 [Dendrobium thyrsiflorum]|uniref:Uncharacterized protein n=1 Tax=Dendrobium thyrsiflorum TaxID=117978 RepID=A0ABD0UQS1_DENTH
MYDYRCQTNRVELRVKCGMCPLTGDFAAKWHHTVDSSAKWRHRVTCPFLECVGKLASFSSFVSASNLLLLSMVATPLYLSSQECNFRMQSLDLSNLCLHQFGKLASFSSFVSASNLLLLSMVATPLYLSSQECNFRIISGFPVLGLLSFTFGGIVHFDSSLALWALITLPSAIVLVLNICCIKSRSPFDLFTMMHRHFSSKRRASSPISELLIFLAINHSHLQLSHPRIANAPIASSSSIVPVKEIGSCPANFTMVNQQSSLPTSGHKSGSKRSHEEISSTLRHPKKRTEIELSTNLPTKKVILAVYNVIKDCNENKVTLMKWDGAMVICSASRLNMFLQYSLEKVSHYFNKLLQAITSLAILPPVEIWYHAYLRNAFRTEVGITYKLSKCRVTSSTRSRTSPSKS